MSRISKSTETESRLMRGCEVGQWVAEWGVTTNQYRVSFGGDENFLKLEHLDLELELECCTTL